MTTSLPVPSKNALRALRHLALATSCTVAFGAGLVTADRRRRIQTANQVCENARRIKSSKRYHSAGATVAVSFEEQVERYYQNESRKRPDTEQLLEPQWNGETSNRAPQPLIIQEELENTLRAVCGPDSVPVHVGAPVKRNIHTFRKIAKYLMQPAFIKPTSKQLYDEAVIQTPVVSLSPQERLAGEVLLHLQDGSNGDMLNKATTAISEFFAGRPLISDIEKPLLEAIALLGQACERLGGFKLYVPTLIHILNHGRIDEQVFCTLQATATVAYLLEESGYTKRKIGRGFTNPEKLEDATAIFCTKLQKQPMQILSTMIELGAQLFEATVEAKLYSLSGRVLEHVAFIGGNIASQDVKKVIRADLKRRDIKSVLHHFFYLFSQTKPDQKSFYQMVQAALDSALEVNRVDEAEKVLLVATQMAKDGHLKLLTSWMLRILGQHWRATRDLVSTGALFGRLVSALENISYPEAVYNAMSQFCIEAGNEVELQKYLDYLEKSPSTDYQGMQTYGNLALAKAMKDDWRGAENNFISMKSLSPNPTKQAALFVPVLKRFAASHKPGEVEMFLQYYVERLGIVPNQYIFEFMISVYCKTKELGCIARWIKVGRASGLNISVVSFNAILSSCKHNWAMDFNDLYSLCKKISAANNRMIDGKTIKILRGAAFSFAGNNPDLTAKLLSKVVSLQQSTGCCLPDDVEMAMRDAWADGKPTKAIDVYEKSINKNEPINPRATALAVRASITVSTDGDLKPACGLIYQARALDTDVCPAMVELLLHKMEVANGKDLQSIAFSALASLEDGGFEITRGAATKVISLLIDRGLERAAIELWTSISARHEKIRESIDIVLLTVLLRAYVQLSDPHGICWVMDVLSLKNIKPDIRFTRTLNNARAAARKLLKACWSNETQIHCSLLDDCVRRAANMNGYIQRLITRARVRSSLSIAPMVNVKDQRLVRRIYNR